MEQERILCSAIWVDDYEFYPHQPINIPTGFVATGLRHCNCFVALSLTKIQYKSLDYVQGFLTNKNRFVDREEGAKIALACGQIEKLNHSDTKLYSEDLY